LGLAHGGGRIGHLGLSRTNLSWGQEARVTIAGQELWLIAESHWVGLALAKGGHGNVHGA